MATLALPRRIERPSLARWLDAGVLVPCPAALLLAFALGTSLAWIVERTNTPLRQWFYGLSLVPIIVPGVLGTIAWIYLLSPKIGWVNTSLMAILGLKDPPFDVFLLGGMIWVEGLHLAPRCSGGARTEDVIPSPSGKR